MAFCGKCGTQLNDGAKFCPKCGTPTQMSAKLGKEEISDEEELQVENEGEKWPIPMVAKVGLILSALLVVYGVLTINTSSFQGIVFIYCIAIGMLLVIWAAFNGYGNMDKKAAYWTIIAALVSFPIIKGADYLFANDETEENETELVEQKQESPAEKQAREKKEQADREANEKQEKIKRVAEIAYKMGYDKRKATWGETLSARGSAEADYRFRYAVDPEDDGQSERWNVFLENYSKGFSDAAEEIMNKFRKEDF